MTELRPLTPHRTHGHRLRVGSLFAGIGGFDLAFERAGAVIAWQAEIDRHASAVLARHWPETPNHRDVREVNRRAAEPVDIVCAGFPCQDLSQAGRRAGLAGTRSGLFFEVVRILRELRPPWVILENVPGLLSSNRGLDMGTVLGRLAQLGYGFAFRVLDAQYFGVPQRRRRVFIAGRLGEPSATAAVLLEPESGCWHPSPRPEAGARAAAIPADGAGGRREAEGRAGGVARALTAHHGRFDPSSELLVAYRKAQKAHDPGDCERWEEAVAAATLDAGSGNTRTAHLITHALLADGADASEDGSGRGTPIVPATVGVRRLTPRECERLQGFPDDWTAGQSDSQRYRQLGNAVCVPVAEWIARRLAACDAGASLAA